MILSQTFQCADDTTTNNFYNARKQQSVTITSARLPPSVLRWTTQRTASACSGLTPLSLTRSRMASQHGTNGCFTLRWAHIRARFPTLLLGCGHAAADSEATRLRSSISYACCSSSKATAQENTRVFLAARPPTAEASSLSPLDPPP